MIFIKKIARFLLYIFLLITSKIFLYVILGFVLMAAAYMFSSTPAAPQIKTAEFPFCLKYELNGEIFEVKDTYVCEFDGYEFSAGTGEKYRVWKGSFKSGKTRITLLRTDGLEFFYFPVYPNGSGLAGKYMGDPEHPSAMVDNFPNAHYTVNFENKASKRYLIFADEMWDKYKLRLISWEMAEPIENVFNKNLWTHIFWFMQ